MLGVEWVCYGFFMCEGVGLVTMGSTPRETRNEFQKRPTIFGAAMESWKKGANLEAEEKLTEFQAHEDCVSSCGFLHNDSIIMTASFDKTIAFWDSSNGKKLHGLCGHKHRVSACCVDEQNSRLLSASWDKSIIYWDIESSEKLWSATHDSLVLACHLSPTNHLAVSGTDRGAVLVWDTRTGQAVHKIRDHANTIMGCRFSHSGLSLCTCSMDRSALVWDLRMQKVLLTLRGHLNVVSACAFSHNDRRIVTASWDKTLRVYDIATGAYRLEGPAVLRHHDGCVSACDFSNDDSVVVSCGYDADVNLWNMNTYQLHKCFKGHEGWIQDAKFGKSNKWVVTCTKEGVVKVWNNETDYKITKSKSIGLDVAKCQTCGKMYSLIESPSGGDLDQCVFCRQKKRSLEHLQELLSP